MKPGRRFGRPKPKPTAALLNAWKRMGIGLDSFDEGKHPRDKDGQFARGGASDSPEKYSGRSRNAAPVAALSGNELGQKEGESLKDAAIRYYDDLRKHPAKREGFGTVNFSRVGRDKLMSASLPEPERLKLLPAVKPLIEKGDYLGRADLTKARKDGIVAFHYFEGNVKTGSGTKFLGVTVGEDINGNRFYNLTENPDVLLKKLLQKERPLLARSKAGGGGLAGDSADEGQILNLIIVPPDKKVNMFQSTPAIRATTSPEKGHASSGQDYPTKVNINPTRRSSMYSIDDKISLVKRCIGAKAAPAATEDGDFPGHPFRGNQHASGHSSGAVHKSGVARGKETRTNHKAAASAHAKALKSSRAGTKTHEYHRIMHEFHKSRS